MANIDYIKELVDLNEEQISKLAKYKQLLIETSKVMNLTTITDEEQIYIKHFYDSILTLKDVENTSDKSLLDVGSGAGFPGLVLKIVYPNLSITLLEPTKKRCDFLNNVIQQLGLTNINVINDRAENYIHTTCNRYDFVCARAVASLNILAEICIPYVKNGGLFIALKGQNYIEEQQNSKHALDVLGAKYVNAYLYELPKNMGTRAIIQYKKCKNTPDIYPRMYAKIKKNPL